MKNKEKLLLMIGGPLVLTGVITRLSGITGFIPILFFILGGGLKLTYLTLGIRSGKLTLGNEVFLLIVGVSLVLFGVFNKTNPDLSYIYPYFLVFGISMKLSFIYLFVRRNRKKQVVEE